MSTRGPQSHLKRSKTDGNLKRQGNPLSSKWCFDLINIRIVPLTRGNSCHGCILKNHRSNECVISDNAYIVRTHLFQNNTIVTVD